MMTIPAPIRIPDAAPRSLRRLEPSGWDSGASAGTAPVDPAVQARLQGPRPVKASTPANTSTPRRTLRP